MPRLSVLAVSTAAHAVCVEGWGGTVGNSGWFGGLGGVYYITWVGILGTCVVPPDVGAIITWLLVVMTALIATNSPLRLAKSFFLLGCWR